MKSDTSNPMLCIMFAGLSWVGNLCDWPHVDSVVSPLMHIVQLIAAIIAIALGLRQLLNKRSSKNILPLFGLLMFCSAIESCSPKAGTTITHTQERSDSTRIVERLRLDTVTIPGDTIRLEIPIGCDSNGNVKPFLIVQENKRSAVRAEVVANRLHAIFNCDEYKEKVWLRDSLIEGYKKELSNRNEVQVIHKRFVPSAYKWAMGYTVLSLLALVLYIAWRIYKIFY